MANTTTRTTGTFYVTFIVALIISQTVTTSATAETEVLVNAKVARAQTSVREKCYPNVGCFSNAPPFDNAHHLLPHSPEEIGTRFSLYTRDGPYSNTTHHFINYTSATSLADSNFTTSKPTKVVVHGFLNDIKTEWLYAMKDELLKKVDCNVIIVSWGPGAQPLFNYDQCVANTRVVATQTKMLIENMVSIGSTFKSIHMIGHSLGAHISGLVGQLLRKDNNTLGRISGLDPAEPDFQNFPMPVRLDKNDADYVDVIHTNGAPFSFSTLDGYGLYTPCGDVDFYVNGGEDQPDCPVNFFAAFSSGNFADAIACSHGRAHQVFIESINSNLCQFTAYPCSSYEKFQNGECLSCGEQGCSVLGYDSDYYFATGMMYLNTRMSKPYCGYHYGIKLRGSYKYHGDIETHGRVTMKLNGTWGVSEWLNITSFNTTITQGVEIKRVAVAEQVVGQITSIQVKYERKSGANSAYLYQINLLSGQSGLPYRFCLNGPLATGVVATLTPSNSVCTDYD